MAEHGAHEYERIFPPCRCIRRRGCGGGRCEHCGGIIPFDPTWGGTVPNPDPVTQALIALHGGKHEQQ